MGRRAPQALPGQNGRPGGAPRRDACRSIGHSRAEWPGALRGRQARAAAARQHRGDRPALRVLSARSRILEPMDQTGAFTARAAGSRRSDSPRRTRALGRALGALARPGMLLALVGPLGAGKTELAKGVAEGLGGGGPGGSTTPFPCYGTSPPPPL